MPLSSSKITSKEFRGLVQAAGGKSYIPKVTQKKLQELGVSSSYKSISKQQAERALGELQKEGLISSRKTVKSILQETISVRDKQLELPKKIYSTAVLRKLPKEITKEELEEIIKKVSNKRYVPKSAKEVLRETKISAYPYKKIKRQEVLGVLEKLKAAGVASKSANLKKTWQWVDSYSKEKEKVFASQDFSGKLLNLKDGDELKGINKKKITDYLGKVAGTKDDVAKAQKILDSLKIKSQEELTSGQLDILFEKLQQAGLAGFEAIKNTWQSFENFIKKGGKVSAKKTLPILGIDYLPEEGIRPDKFVEYIGKVAEDSLAGARAKNIMRDLNMDTHEHLTVKQMENILKKLQSAGMAGTNTSMDPIGKRIAKRESLRKAWVAMGIADEDDEFGRFARKTDKLPTGIRRTVGTKAVTSALGESESEKIPGKHSSLESKKDIFSKTSAIGEAVRKNSPSSSASNKNPLSSSANKNKSEFDENNPQLNLPDIFSDI